jgi:hypothetical protein
VPEGHPPDWQSLVVGYNVHPVTAAPYLADWQHHFDAVLLLNAGGAGDLRQFLPGELTLVAASDVAALYRIRRDCRRPLAGAGLGSLGDVPVGGVRLPSPALLPV